jgi:hypothetical protein
MHVLNPSGYIKVVFGVLSVCRYIWMCASEAAKWLNRFYSYLVGQYLVNVTIPVSNIGVLRMVPRTQNGNYLENN